MAIKSLQEILKDILKEGRKTPGEWKTLLAPTSDRFGSDLLLFHPTTGPIYQVRAYEKNPFQMTGMGTRIARNVDEDFLKLIRRKKSHGNLGILDLDYRIIREALTEGTKLDQIFLNALKGKKDQGIEFVNLGDAFRSRSERPLPLLTDNQKKLDKEYKRLLKREGKTSMYG
ncbi:MAG: hypothetical protein JSW11_16085 [Candidatus Heimdallarchaeota archaeon]|nr:MAG: hypothetical protein JSW11_16085 [Candidatus Heimdallarchaeota archaeon]